jgi:asparagine synthase (glutamine-hydrolysing)
VVRHGRPLSTSDHHSIWISADWPNDQVHTTESCRGRAILLGPAIGDQEDLDGEFSSAVAGRGFAKIAGGFGSHWTVIEIGERVLGFSDVPGLRILYRCSVGGRELYSSSCLLLSSLTGREINVAWLSGFLVGPDSPELILEGTPFSRVHSVPPGHYVHFGPTKSAPARYWTPPAAELPLRQGAERLGVALDSAVCRRTKPMDEVTSDLSGGFDSSTLAALAARNLAQQDKRLQTLTYVPPRAPSFEDLARFPIASARPPRRSTRP